MPTLQAVRTYHLISADSHVNEPPDLWVDRMPARFADRAPRMERFDEGDAWIFEGVADPMPIGLNACAGMDPPMRRSWVRWDEIRAGGYDPKVRIQEIDRDGVDAEVLYPTPRMAQAIHAQEDPEFHLAMVQAYNDWLTEYAEHDLARFRGLAMLPNRGVEQALAEIERVADRPAIGGFVIGRYPSGELTPQPADDPVWAALVERELTLNIHVSLTTGMPAGSVSRPLPGAGRFNAMTGHLIDLVFSGVLDRFPTLRVVAAEVDCGWLPYFKEQIDDNYRRFKHNHALDLFPSEYIERNVHFTYVTDTYGIDNRDRIGVERILWSSDYPHASSSWPETWPAVQASMSGVPAAERDLMLVGNAARLYGFAQAAESPTGAK